MKRAILFLVVFILAGCRTQQQTTPVPKATATSASLSTSVSHPTTTSQPTPIPTTIEATAGGIITPEPTPTTAVCTPLPADMSLNILYDSDRHGVIEVEGLEPGERPTLLLTGQGEVTSDWWRKETQYENAVGADGRMQYRFDFRGWDSVEGVEFKGQLIHQRGVACFSIDLPLATTTAVPNQTPSQSTQAEDVIAHLETLQTKYEQMLNDHEGWLYAHYTDYFPTALRGSETAVNFLWLADTWVWEYWYEVSQGVVIRQIIHVSDENGGIWQRQLIDDGWTAWVLPVETLGERVQRLDNSTPNANTLWGPYRLIQQLQDTTKPDVTAWEADDLYHVTLYDSYEPPIEIVGFEEPVAASRVHFVFDNKRGVVVQQSTESLLAGGEWMQTQEVNLTQFDLLAQLPDNAARTLEEGTALIDAYR